MKKYYLLVFSIFLLLLSCFPYVYYNQEKVLINGIDMDQSLEIAGIELNDGGFDSVLTLWALRDQIITSENAREITELYFKHIDALKDDFGIWHLAWAISNFYRNGNDDIKSILQDAYNDAVKRPDTLKKYNKIADELINGKKIYMGDIHGLGKAYARTHIVAPGNNDYLQSFEEYLLKKESNEKNSFKYDKIRKNI